MKGRRRYSAVRVERSNKEDPYRRCSTGIVCVLYHETDSEYVGENDKRIREGSSIIPTVYSQIKAARADEEEAQGQPLFLFVAPGGR